MKYINLIFAVLLLVLVILFTCVLNTKPTINTSENKSEYLTNEALIEDFNTFDSTAIINSIYKFNYRDQNGNPDSIINIVILYKDSLFYYKSKDTYANYLLIQRKDGDYLK